MMPSDLDEFVQLSILMPAGPLRAAFVAAGVRASFSEIDLWIYSNIDWLKDYIEVTHLFNDKLGIRLFGNFTYGFLSHDMGYDIIVTEVFRNTK